MVSVQVSQQPTQVSVETETNLINVTKPAVVEVQVDAVGIQGAKGDKGDSGASTIANVAGLQAALDSKLAVQSAEFKVQALQGYSSTRTIINEDTDGNVSQIQTRDLTETVLLLTQDFSYVGGNLSAIVYTNGRTNATLTKTFSYSGGTLVAIEVN